MFVLGALLFMALLFVVFLFYRNKELRRALDKSSHNSVTDAVYEDINISFITTRATSSPHRDISENYDDAIITGITPTIIADTSEDYDDVIAAGQDAEDYDDVEELPKN
ncbi:hypothetical protein KOW79_016278 [Hemibagrus wyckioides]|uniref:Uncharacterized protein n=1 Tax=Hemibagrus wyckioides TaxID=337641 RepID=A0A9D3NE15_9TELE|nr:hypothetical protein KOW79_016278 [Hemibagrus wyckioides]